MDIIEANKCLRHWYGPPRKGTFDNTDVKVTEGEPIPQIVSPKEASKAQVAAYKEAIEEAAKVAAEAAAEAAVEAAANAVADALSGEPGGPGKPVVIEPDDDESESYNKDAYATFKEAIEVENYKASNIEAL